jgi:exonuclease SbcC
VEEYRECYSKLLPVENLVRKNIRAFESSLSRLHGRLERYPQVTNEMDALSKEVNGLTSGLKTKQKELERTKNRKEILDGQKKKLDELTKEKELKENEIKNQLRSLSRLRQDVQKASKAQEKAHKLKKNADKHNKLKQDLEATRKILKERTILEKDKITLERKVEVAEKEVDVFIKQINDNKTAQKRQIELTPSYDRYKEIKKGLEPFNNRIIALEKKVARLDAERNNISKYEDEAYELREAVKDLEMLKRRSSEYEPSDKMLKELQDRTSRLKQRIEDNQKAEKGFAKGNCPYTDNVCPVAKNVKNEVKNKISRAQVEISACEKRFVHLRNKFTEAENAVYKVKSLSKDAQRLTKVEMTIKSAEKTVKALEIEIEELKTLKERAEVFRKELTQLEEKTKEFEALNKIIEKENIDRLPKEVERLKRSISKGKKEIIDVEKRINDLKVKGASDDHETRILKELNGLESDFFEYRRCLEQAKTLPKLQNELLDEEKREKETKETIKKLEIDLQHLLIEYNKDQHESVINLTLSLDREIAGIKASIKEKDKRLSDLMKELKDLEKIKKEVSQLKGELKEEEKTLDYIGFVRSLFKTSSEPIVTELVGRIGKEANNIYCGIMQDYAQELRWTNDYDIVVNENGKDKTFRQLSGGEQMSAALAVRLALLKTVSGSDVVFLDEPTQNMDDIRREGLAEQLMEVTGFKQVFLISHDDTFSSDYQNIIKIEKVGGKSRVVT